MARDTYEDVDQRDTEAKPEVLGTVLVIFTTIALLAACWVMQKGLKDHYNAGMFAEKTASGAP
jgi:hypothetical protein